MVLGVIRPIRRTGQPKVRSPKRPERSSRLNYLCRVFSPDCNSGINSGVRRLINGFKVRLKSHPKQKQSRASPYKFSAGRAVVKMATKRKAVAPPLPKELPPTTIHFPPPAPGTSTKIGPQRTTKVTQKLKLLPEDKSSASTSTLTGAIQERDPVAQRDIERWFASKERIAKFLPRVTAYCTASSYRMEGLMKFLKARASTRMAEPQSFDEWYVHID
jgi:hypothetical protein